MPVKTMLLLKLDRRFSLYTVPRNCKRSKYNDIFLHLVASEENRLYKVWIVMIDLLIDQEIDFEIDFDIAFVIDQKIDVDIELLIVSSTTEKSLLLADLARTLTCCSILF